MKRRRGKIERQLYTLLNRLQAYVPNADELGALVGYCIIESLHDFDTNTGSTEQVEFEEIKAVYNGLEQVIESSKENDGYTTLCELKMTADPWIIESLEPEAGYQRKSTLVQIAMNYLQSSGRDFQDKLRRKGKQIVSDVTSRGPVTGAKNSLSRDYNLVNMILK
ncbi:hypothetical protein ACFL3V_00575 [Nanoarchaeota archaeon]